VRFGHSKGESLASPINLKLSRCGSTAQYSPNSLNAPVEVNNHAKQRDMAVLSSTSISCTEFCPCEAVTEVCCNELTFLTNANDSKK